MNEKTYDGQTAAFLAKVATCMPKLSSDVMQGWMDNPKALQKALATALTPPEQDWYEKDNVIYFSLTSRGITGKGWTEHFVYERRRGLADGSEQLLLSSDFEETNAVTYDIVVLKGALFEDGKRSTEHILAYAEERNFVRPNMEVICLIREKFSDEDIDDMGLTKIAALHESVQDCDGELALLVVDNSGTGNGDLGLCYDSPKKEWYRESGFAFIVSKIKMVD